MEPPVVFLHLLAGMEVAITTAASTFESDADAAATASTFESDAAVVDAAAAAAVADAFPTVLEDGRFSVNRFQ